ncbi:hypothetical protein P4133_01980 [Pseudomonas aeruginosa]|nr:hypothetical protein [Pseudomonas aeruginosa]MDF5996148.1 hypothetical protein [Pseudomonas aeruginosa]
MLILLPLALPAAGCGQLCVAVQQFLFALLAVLLRIGQLLAQLLVLLRRARRRWCGAGLVQKLGVLLPAPGQLLQHVEQLRMTLQTGVLGDVGGVFGNQLRQQLAEVAGEFLGSIFEPHWPLLLTAGP